VPVPAHPRIDDPSLAARRWELFRNLSEFLKGDLRPAAQDPSEKDAPPAESNPGSKDAAPARN